MELKDLVEKIKDTYNARQVFGEPFTQDGVTVIPAARMRGGGGGGGGEGPEKEGKGSGGGFGLAAAPAGVFELREGHVKWKPAVDPNRIVLGAQIVFAVALWTVGRILAAKLRRR